MPEPLPIVECLCQLPTQPTGILLVFCENTNHIQSHMNFRSKPDTVVKIFAYSEVVYKREKTC